MPDESSRGHGPGEQRGRPRAVRGDSRGSGRAMAGIRMRRWRCSWLILRRGMTCSPRLSGWSRMSWTARLPGTRVDGRGRTARPGPPVTRLPVTCPPVPRPAAVPLAGGRLAGVRGRGWRSAWMRGRCRAARPRPARRGGPGAGSRPGMCWMSRCRIRALAGLADAAASGGTGVGRAYARLSDDELIGVLGGWRKTEAWAAAGRLSAVAELIARRPAEPSGDPGTADGPPVGPNVIPGDSSAGAASWDGARLRRPDGARGPAVRTRRRTARFRPGGGSSAPMSWRWRWRSPGRPPSGCWRWRMIWRPGCRGPPRPCTRASSTPIRRSSSPRPPGCWTTRPRPPPRPPSSAPGSAARRRGSSAPRPAGRSCKPTPPPRGNGGRRRRRTRGWSCGARMPGRRRCAGSGCRRMRRWPPISGSGTARSS